MTLAVSRLSGTARASRFQNDPVLRITCAAATPVSWRMARGSRMMPNIARNIPPGTPATAIRPATRSGYRRANSKPTLTPMDQHGMTARSISSWSSSASRSPTWSSMRTREGSAGRSPPPVPR